MTIKVKLRARRLWNAVDKGTDNERIEQATSTKDSGKLLLTEEEWAARMKEKKSGEASSSRGGDSKHRSKASSEKKKKVDPNACDAVGRWAIG